MVVGLDGGEDEEITDRWPCGLGWLQHEVR